MLSGMARTMNPTLHTVRRDAFLDVAQRLIQTKGYEAMSIQDLLDQLEASKGAFYHYFDSKLALLEAVIERFADTGMAGIPSILDDPELPALRKLERVFASIARFKAEQKEMVLAVMEVWKSDGNALAREKLRRLSASRLLPLLTVVVRQGVNEGTIHVASPDEATKVLVALMQGFQEIVADDFIARQAGTITFEHARRSVESFTDAFERILGVPKGSVTLTDEPTLRFWFG
jgi:AcrR family transcriptional regulator